MKRKRKVHLRPKKLPKIQQTSKINLVPVKTPEHNIYATLSEIEDAWQLLCIKDN